jgi:hypothetical protein
VAEGLVKAPSKLPTVRLGDFKPNPTKASHYKFYLDLFTGCVKTSSVY